MYGVHLVAQTQNNIKMNNLINLTPHPIHILGEDNKLLRTIESSGIARLAVKTANAGFSVDGVKITKTVFGEPEGLPEEKLEKTPTFASCECGRDYPHNHIPTYCGQCGNPDLHISWDDVPTTYYIVSQLVKNALFSRKDLLVPAEVVRDEQGVILGCKSLGI